MGFVEALPRLARKRDLGVTGTSSGLVEAPVIGLLAWRRNLQFIGISSGLAVVVLALAWTLTRVLAFLPRLPNAIVEAMSQAGEQSGDAFKRAMDELQETIRELQRALHEERERLARKRNWESQVFPPGWMRQMRRSPR